MKKKKLLIIILIIAFVLLISLGIGIYIFINSKKLRISFKNNIVVNINDEIYNLDYVKKVKNGTILTKKEKIDTSKTGTKEVSIKVKNYFKKIKI